MKRGILFKLISGLLIYAHVFWSAVVFAEIRRPAGIVYSLSGEAHVARGSEPNYSEALKFRDEVFYQDRIRTKEHSLVRVLLGGKAVLTIRALSEVTITEQPGGPSNVEITSGKVSLGVARSRMSPGEEIEIRTPNAVVAVRGTLLIVEVEPASTDQAPATTTFSLLQGSANVSVRGGSGGAVALGALQSVSVTGTSIGQVFEITPSQIGQVLWGLTMPDVPGTLQEAQQTLTTP